MSVTPWLAVLLAAICRHFGSGYAQGGGFDPPPNTPCRTCAAQPGCLNVTTVGYAIGDLACASPLWLPAVVATCITTQIDSQCWTFFAIDDSSYLVFVTTTNIDANVNYESFIISDVANAKGSHRIQGLATDSGCSTLLSQQCIIGVACDQTWVVYKCDYYQGEDYPFDGSGCYDQRYALSSNPIIDPCCQNRVKAIFDSRSFCGDDIHYAPYQNWPKCVATFNGAKCINYEKLDQRSHIYLPTDSMCLPAQQPYPVGE